MLSTALKQDANHPLWVQQLPRDFYRQPQKVRLPADPALAFTIAVDLAVRTGLSAWMAAVSFPMGYLDPKLGSTLRGEHSSHTGSDEEVFHQTRPMPLFKVTPAPPPKGVETGIFEKIEWRSVYSASDHIAYDNNNGAVAWHWRHGDRPRPTIILVHGFLASWWEVNEYYLGSRFLYELGCDVILKTLPHHGPRSRHAKNVSGMDFMSRGIDVLNHAVVQSTYDIRTLMDFLQQREVADIGITGVSLGGYTTALMASLDNRLKFAIPQVPIVSLPDTMLEWKPLDRLLNIAMRWYGVNMEDVRATMAIHSPLTRPVLLPAERLLIIGGMGDKLAPPIHSETLQQHWGNCALHWYAGAHCLIREQSQNNQIKKVFLQNIGFIS